MLWYEGNIGEAIQKSKNEGAVFGVAIFGDDENSKQLEVSLNSENVQTALGNGKFVCIRITADSEEHKQFSRIYSNAPSPSIYLIGDKGATLEVVASQLSPPELEEKLKSAWSRHSSPPPASAVNVNQSSSGPSATRGAATSSSGIEKSISNTAQALANAKEAVKKAEDAASQSNLSLEEKIERAQKLAAAKRQQKLAQEAEDERQRERERRDMGKGMAELKRWQEEQAAKQLVEERRKEKREEQELRARVKEQIAQDRAARNARSNVSFLNDGPVDPDAPTTSSSPAGSRPVGVTVAAVPKDYTGKARLQFRMPTGSSISHVFEPDTSLGDVRDFLVTNNHVTFRQFTLSVAYPRRQFVASDYSSTLRDLGLIPSAALLVLPVSGSSSMPGLGSGGSSLGTWFSIIIGYLFIPFTFIYSLFQRALPSPSPSSSSPASSSNQPPAAKRPRPSTSPSASSNDPASSANPRGDSSSSTSSEVRNRKGNKGESSVKRSEGNIHRLRTNEEDSDDDQGTWNGNSTQQM